MRKSALIATFLLASLTLFTGSALGETKFGVADDAPKYAADGGDAFFTRMTDAGLSETRVTVLWDATRPATIAEKAHLDRMFPQAAAHGVRIILSVYPAKARSLTDTPNGAAQFASFVGQLARTYPAVDEYIIGNEFNQLRFFQPQFGANCARYAGGAYMGVLARSYDVLKAINPSIRVTTSVSPRGNDDCNAPSNASASPCRFVHDMGVSFKAMGRTRPAFDEWASHVYPNQPTDGLSKGYPWPNIGFANLDRLKQCVWDAFDGTAQPTFERGGAFRLGQSVAALVPLKLNLAEVGWQVGVVPSAKDAYTGRENVKVTDESTQAKIYGDLVRQASCDPSIESVLFFGLRDDENLDRFQAGLIRADGTLRPSYAAVREAIAATGGECLGKLVDWKHASSVDDGKADFTKALGPKPVAQTYWGFQATADEDSTYRAGVFRLAGPSISASQRGAIKRALSGSSSGRSLVLAKAGRIKAYWSPIVRFRSTRLEPGYYAYAIRIAAELNPSRTQLAVSRPFVVGKPAKSSAR